MIKLFILFLTTISIWSCTKVGLGYSIASERIIDRVDDTFSFSPRSKSKEVEIFLESEFRNNKNKVVVKAQSLLQAIKLLTLKNSIQFEDVEALVKNLQNFQKDTIYLFQPSFNKVLSEIDQKEIQTFRENSLKRIVEAENENKNLDAFKKKKIKNFMLALDFLFDEVTVQQQNSVEQFVGRHLDFYAEQIQSRKKFNESLFELFPNKNKMIEHSLYYYSGHSSVRSEKYNRLRSDYELGFKNLILSLWSQSSKEQKKFLQQRLDNLLQELEKNL